MPLEIKNYVGDSGYASPLVGPVNHTRHGKVDLSTLTIAEVDADGFLKPGVILKESGGLLIPIGGVAGIPLLVPEATKLNLAAALPPTDVTLAAETGDHLIGVVVHGQVNRDIAEDNMGRVYNAFELASFPLAGSQLSLTTT